MPNLAGDDNRVNLSPALFAVILMIFIGGIILIPLIWIVTYRVVQDKRDRRKQKEEQERKANDVEAAHELGAEEKAGRGPFEMEQPPMPELPGGDVKELWSSDCAKEKDGQMAAAEMDAGAVDGVGDEPAPPAS